MGHILISSSSAADVAFLAGLEAAEVEGAAELVELLDRHDELELWIGH